MRTLFLRALAIAAVGAIAFGNASLAGKGELRFIGWEGYADDDWVAEFEEKYDADVSVFYIGSNDEMFAKMKASEAQDYDVMTVNTGELQRHIDLGLVKAARPQPHTQHQELAAGVPGPGHGAGRREGWATVRRAVLLGLDHADLQQGHRGPSADLMGGVVGPEV